MRRLLTVCAALSAFLVLAGCGDDLEGDETSRDESGEVVEGGDVGSLSLNVGDCIESAAVGSVTDVPVVPCSDPHDSEVIALFDMEDGDFPGAAEAQSIAQTECTGSLFTDYVGLDYQSSIYGVSFLVPTEETWDAIDDREIVCLATDAAGAPLTGSVKGSAE
jgi:hypothetical protein